MPDRPDTARRRDALRASLAADDVAALLVSSVPNVSYLTGFGGDATSLLLTADRALAISDPRYTAQLAEECPDVEAHIRPIGQPMMVGVAEVVTRLGLPRVGFESNILTVSDFETLRDAAPTVSFRGVRGRVEALRMLKDDGEVAAVRRAIAIAEAAFAQVRPLLRPGCTEKQVADALEAGIRAHGGAGSSFPPLVAVGPRSALPHARPMEEALGPADLLLVDWGAVAPGLPYRSDLTRVVVTGSLSARFEEVYRSVLEAHRRAVAAVRPGVSARAVDAEARAALEEAGFGAFFDHGTGHGLGLEIHEAPILRRECEVPLRPGMVVTIEPGVYLPGWGGVRIEDDLLVTPDGPEVLTHLPRDLDAARLA